MKPYDATEQAYKNGYQAGFEEGKKQARPAAYWESEDGKKVMMDPQGYPLAECRCSNCKEILFGSDTNWVRGIYCPNCGAEMQP